MNWHSRPILSSRMSDILDAGGCVGALNDALKRHCTPRILITDQQSQFTSLAFLNVLWCHCVATSMDGKGRPRDNV